VEYRRATVFLAAIYTPPFGTADKRRLGKRIAEVAAALWPAPSEYDEENDDYKEAYAIFRYVILRQTDPVVLLELTNTSEDPASITSVTCDVQQFIAAKDSNESGPLPILDTVTVELDRQPGRITAPLPNGTQKLAPKDAASIQVRLKSKVKGIYRMAITVNGDDGPLYTTPPFLLGFLVS
jgi:hypothetical protein